LTPLTRASSAPAQPTFVERDPDSHREGERHSWIHTSSAVLREHTDERRRRHPVAQSCSQQQPVRCGALWDRRRGTGVGGVEAANVEVPVN